MSWTLITSGGKGKESPFYREFLITSASDLQNEPDMSIATGSIACIVGSGLAMAHKYMKGQSGQWTEIPADVFDVQINGTSITNNGVANIPIATTTNLGVVKFNNSYSIGKDEYGNVVGIPNSYSEYLSALPQSIVSKGTLDNIIDNNNNKLIAISNAKNIDIIMERPSLTTYEQFIIENDIMNETIVKDIGNIVESGSTKYYTSFSNAILDANNRSSSGSTTDPTNAVCSLHINENNIYCIKILQNISNATNTSISVTKDLIIDFNGFIINNCRFSIYDPTDYNKISTFCLYGNKTGSKYTYTNSNRFNQQIYSLSCRLYAIGFSIEETITGSNGYEYLFYPQRAGFVYLKNLTSKFSTESKIQRIFLMMISSSNNIHVNTIYKIENCNISGTWKGMSGMGTSLIDGNGEFYTSLYVNNSNISVTQINDANDNISYAINGLSLNNLVIKNSNIFGTNAAFASAGANVYVSNSVLSGVEHGAFYSSRTMDSATSTSYESKVYIKDSTIKQKSQDNISPNPHSCYMGYGSSTYFDNCKFESEITLNNSAPAIKDGSSGTANTNTKAYFSNCIIPSNTIRIDETCVAYMGLGISNELKQYVSTGLNIDSGCTTYSYRLLENELIDGNLSNKEV